MLAERLLRAASRRFTVASEIAARACDRHELHPIDVPERKDDALVGQLGEHGVRAAKGLAHFGGRMDRLAFGQVAGRKEPDDAPAAPSQDAFPRLADGDAREPAAECVGVLQLVDRRERDDEHVLQEVDDLLIRPEDAAKDPLDVSL